MLSSLPPKKYLGKRSKPSQGRIVLVWFYAEQVDGVRAYCKNRRWYFSKSGLLIKNTVTHWAEI